MCNYNIVMNKLDKFSLCNLFICHEKEHQLSSDAHPVKFWYQITEYNFHAYPIPVSCFTSAVFLPGISVADVLQIREMNGNSRFTKERNVLSIFNIKRKRKDTK